MPNRVLPRPTGSKKTEPRITQRLRRQPKDEPANDAHGPVDHLPNDARNFSFFASASSCKRRMSIVICFSIDFDGTLVAHGTDSVLDRGCMEHIEKLQGDGVIWAINTGRSVSLLESGLVDFEFPIHPDFILTSERDVFRPSSNGAKWEPFGDWNERVAREHAELFHSAKAVLAE